MATKKLAYLPRIREVFEPQNRTVSAGSPGKFTSSRLLSTVLQFLIGLKIPKYKKVLHHRYLPKNLYGFKKEIRCKHSKAINISELSCKYFSNNNGGCRK
jgi:hypothetical protein